jgi:hypothetical protein
MHEDSILALKSSDGSGNPRRYKLLLGVDELRAIVKQWRKSAEFRMGFWFIL